MPFFMAAGSHCAVFLALNPGGNRGEGNVDRHREVPGLGQETRAFGLCGSWTGTGNRAPVETWTGTEKHGPCSRGLGQALRNEQGVGARTASANQADVAGTGAARLSRKRGNVDRHRESNEVSAPEPLPRAGPASRHPVRSMISSNARSSGKRPFQQEEITSLTESALNGNPTLSGGYPDLALREHRKLQFSLHRQPRRLSMSPKNLQYTAWRYRQRPWCR